MTTCSIGSMTASLAHPRDIFRPAIANLTASLIFLPGHDRSRADQTTTRAETRSQANMIPSIPPVPGRGWRFHLLMEGFSNTKMARMADELGVLPFALSLSPFTRPVSGTSALSRPPDARPSASPTREGLAPCRPSTRPARKKTRFFFADRAGFLELPRVDLAKAQRLAKRN